MGGGCMIDMLLLIVEEDLSLEVTLEMLGYQKVCNRAGD